MGASGTILTPGMHAKVSVSRLPHRVPTQSGFVCLFNWFLTILLRIIYFIYSNAAAVMQFLPVTWNPYFRKSQHNNHNNSSAFTWLIHSRLFTWHLGYSSPKWACPGRLLCLLMIGVLISSENYVYIGTSICWFAGDCYYCFWRCWGTAGASHACRSVKLTNAL